MITPYYLDYKMFFSVVYRSIFAPSKIHAKLGIKRIIFLLIFVPFFLWIQFVNFICFFLDEIFFRGYKQQEIKKPMFIAGIPRSGTTFMHRLFSLDDQFTAVKTWEMIYAPTVTQKYFWSFIGKLDGLMGSPMKRMMIAREQAVAKEFNKIHKVGNFETEEDEYLFISSFTTASFYFFFPDERLLDYIFFDEKIPAKKRKRIMDYRKVLIQKHMYVFGKNKTYMTKNPQDCGKIASIMETFPDAKIVYLVRTPYESVASVLNLFHNMFKVVNDEMDKKQLQELVSLSITYWYDYAEKVLQSIAEDQRVTVMYADMVANPTQTAEFVYGQLGLTISDQYREILVAETEKAKGYKSRHNYNIETHGLTNEYVAETYSHVFETYGIEK